MGPLSSSWPPGKRITAQSSSSEVVSGYMPRYAVGNFFTSILVTRDGSQAPTIVEHPPTLKFGLVRSRIQKASLTKLNLVTFLCYWQFVQMQVQVLQCAGGL